MTSRLRPDPARARPMRLSWEAYAVLAAVGLVIVFGATWAMLGPGGEAEPPASIDLPNHTHADGTTDTHEAGPDGPNANATQASNGTVDVDETRPVDTVFAAPADPGVPVITDEATVLDTCRGERDLVECVLLYLEARLSADGSEAAFWMLENMTLVDTTIDQQSHTLAHLLGRYALHDHGTITATLGTCSYRVFQGCFHGALQEFFEETGALDPTTIRELCPPGTPFERYSCVHGLGHGLTLVTHYAMNAALGLCDHLNTSHDRGSCYGGVFMENVVAYMGSKAGGHVHGHDHSYSVDPNNLHHPCDAVDEDYRRDCWLMQTSLILYLNGGDFRHAAGICAELEDSLNLTCYRSYGRDASAWMARASYRVAQLCSYAADAPGRAACIRGYAAEVVLNYADPMVGIEKCRELLEVDKQPCYAEVGGQGRPMIGSDAMAPVCDAAEPEHVDTCRRAAGLAPLET